MTERFTEADDAADAIVRRVGRRIVLGLPLGLGKANHVANALYARAAADSWIDLTIVTALSLDPPKGGDDFAGRFAGPLADRLYDGETRLAYVEARAKNALPPNVRVIEFFLQAGTLLSNAGAQMSYVSANYTHAAPMLLAAGINVIAQMVAPAAGDARFSLSSNPDITLDILPALEKRRQEGEAIVIVGEVNRNLPFMGGCAVLAEDVFDMLLEGTSEGARLFSVPRQPVLDAEHAIGLYCAALVPDGGTIQIGIGSLGDAIANALILRHKDPDAFSECLRALGHWPKTLEAHIGRFEEGLYGLSEMFVDGLLELFDAGILRRPARDGSVLHAGFFIGCESFYRRLREMPPERRDLLSMREISFVNDLPHEGFSAHTHDRRDARFFNAAMIATPLGDICSDQLEDGRVVSGVGGQYNFVAQAFRLPGARSVLALPATRNGGRQSNIRWAYGHTTIPRHLKDIVVTEYGVADLRGRTDRDTVAAMIGLADERYQPSLLKRAKASLKLEKEFAVPSRRRNTADGLRARLGPFRGAGLLPDYPFGTDLTAEERRLVPALKLLKAAEGDRLALAKLAWNGWRQHAPSNDEAAALRRMRLDAPSSIREKAMRALLLGALAASRG